MIIELTEQQRDLLIQLVDREIAGLGPEIRHTRTSSLREELKVERKLLEALAEELRSPENASAGF